MVPTWLEQAMAGYNRASLESRQAYAAQVHLPGPILATVLEWSFRALPDEILVGMDAGAPHHPEVEALFRGGEHREGLFAGQGRVLADATFVNQGDSWSVHHVPEEWHDDLLAPSRGPRGARFLHWLHTHPNAVAVPSEQDADAAADSPGVDLILGLEFSPEGWLPWFDEADGVRRRLEPGVRAGSGDPGWEVADEAGMEAEEVVDEPEDRRRGWARRRRARRRWGGDAPPGDGREVLGLAPTGHRIHGLELICFHRSGLGVNVVLVDEQGWPYGWQELR